MKNTKSGHQIYEQHCWNEYDKKDNKEYKGYEYYFSNSNILYIYEDGELIKSVEMCEPKWTYDNWAKYYIQGLINKSQTH